MHKDGELWECQKCGVVVRQRLKPQTLSNGDCEESSTHDHRWEKIEEEEKDE